MTAVGGKNCLTHSLKYLPPTDGYTFEFGLFEGRGPRSTNSHKNIYKPAYQEIREVDHPGRVPNPGRVTNSRAFVYILNHDYFGCQYVNTYALE